MLWIFGTGPAGVVVAGATSAAKGFAGVVTTGAAGAAFVVAAFVVAAFVVAAFVVAAFVVAADLRVVAILNTFTFTSTLRIAVRAL